MGTSDEESVLTLEETKKTVLAAIRGTGQCSREQLARAIEWAAEVRIDAVMLELVLDRKLLIRVPTDAVGELEFVYNEHAEASPQ